MLSLLSKHITKNHIGLHRDGGLAILKNASVPEGKKLNKQFIKLLMSNATEKLLITST